MATGTSGNECIQGNGRQTAKRNSSPMNFIRDEHAYRRQVAHIHIHSHFGFEDSSQATRRQLATGKPGNQCIQVNGRQTAKKNSNPKKLIRNEYAIRSRVAHIHFGPALVFLGNSQATRSQLSTGKPVNQCIHLSVRYISMPTTLQ